VLEHSPNVRRMSAATCYFDECRLQRRNKAHAFITRHLYQATSEYPVFAL